MSQLRRPRGREIGYTWMFGDDYGGYSSAIRGNQPRSNTRSDPAAQSAPDACSSANQAEILSSVSQNVSNYLANHPDVNQALTDISHEPSAAANNDFHGYFLNVNPQAGHDLHGIQAPLAANQQQCGRQMNATDTLGAFQGL